MIVGRETREARDSRARAVCVLAVDPGETTGYAWCALPQKKLSTLGLQATLRWAAGTSVNSGAIWGRACLGWGQIHRYAGGDGVMAPQAAGVRFEVAEARVGSAVVDVAALASTHLQNLGLGVQPVFEVIMEDFIIRERTKRRDLLSPVRVTASIVTAMELSTSLMVLGDLQSPSNAKTTVTDDRLKRMGLWQRGQPHARDALRHLVLGLRRMQ